jgi:hypothetical protein
LREALAGVDELLASSEGAAIARLRTLSEDGALRGFGSGLLVPKRDYTLAELRLHQIQADKLLSPRDETLEAVRLQSVTVLALVLGALTVVCHPSTSTLMYGGLAAAAAVTADVIGGGAVESVCLDTLGRALSSSYAQRVVRHESGHFLIAYLLGVLPVSYCISAWNALRSSGRAAQAGVQFCESAGLAAEMNSGKLSSASLDRYACIALAGVCAEYNKFGHSEGGLSDIQQLDGLLRDLRFTQKKADSGALVVGDAIVF